MKLFIDLYLRFRHLDVDTTTRVLLCNTLQDKSVCIGLNDSVALLSFYKWLGAVKLRLTNVSDYDSAEPQM